MKLPPNSLIASDKIKKYLLTRRAVDDKSRFLESIGYSIQQSDRLEADLRAQVLVKEATFTESTEYGDVYEIRCLLEGPNGTSARVVTIWIDERRTGLVKFVTLFPDRRR